MHKIAWWFPREVRLQLALYLLGCVLFSIGVKMFIDASLGTDPLHAMIIGIVDTVELPFIKIGFVESAVALGFLVLWSA